MATPEPNKKQSPAKTGGPKLPAEIAALRDRVLKEELSGLPEAFRESISAKVVPSADAWSTQVTQAFTELRTQLREIITAETSTHILASLRRGEFKSQVLQELEIDRMMELCLDAAWLCASGRVIQKDLLPTDTADIESNTVRPGAQVPQKATQILELGLAPVILTANYSTNFRAMLEAPNQFIAPEDISGMAKYSVLLGAPGWYGKMDGGVDGAIASVRKVVDGAVLRSFWKHSDPVVIESDNLPTIFGAEVPSDGILIYVPARFGLATVGYFAVFHPFSQGDSQKMDSGTHPLELFSREIIPYLLQVGSAFAEGLARVHRIEKSSADLRQGS